MQTALAAAVLAQVGYQADWSGFWIFLAAAGAVAVVTVILFFRSQPPD